MLATDLSVQWIDEAKKVTLKELLEAKAARSGRPLWSPLISIPETGTLAEAMNLMRKHSLTALPVFSYTGSLGQIPLSQTYRGILNITDILALTVFQRVFEDVEYSELVDESTGLQRFARMNQEEAALAQTPVSEILGLTLESARSINQVFSTTDSLWTLLQSKMVRDHRVLVTDPSDPSHVGMLTQTDFLAFILENPRLDEALGRLLTAPAMALRRRGPSDIDSDPNQSVTAKRDHFVLSIQDSVQALAAFKVMYIHRVSSLAIVDSQTKKLKNTLSAADLSKVSLDRLQDLLLPVSEYLTKIKGEPSPKKKTLITCQRESILSGIVHEALQHHVHRVWIVDQEGKPEGMVSFSDILALLAA